MRVAFLLQDLQLSDGVGAVVEHASQRAAHHGFDVTLAMTRKQEEPELRGTARLLDLLTHERRYLHFLRVNALETAKAWPSWEQSSTFMAAALSAIRRLPPPDPCGLGRFLPPRLRTRRPPWVQRSEHWSASWRNSVD